MKRVTEGLNPEKTLYYFEEICKIPHGSGNEARIAEYIEDFARSRGYFCLRDDENNVFVRMAATPGREGESAVLLQGHTDMVCEKNADVAHDFERDGLDIYVDGNYLRARGTTLGGDDGIAVATMLALLDGVCPSHPTLEFLFTTSEETGLNGASSFDYSLVTADLMINMDSEEEGTVIVGCAGGMRTDLFLPFEYYPVGGDGALEVSVRGLAGGHSGENINDGRANAIKMLARLLALAGELRLVSLSGGSKDNAIPREANAVIIPRDANAAQTIEAEAKKAAAELASEDGGFSVSVKRCSADTAMSAKRSREIVALLANVQNGVIKMCANVEGQVEFSRNLGVAAVEDGRLVLTFSSRSSVEAQLDLSGKELDLLATLAGGITRHRSRYPGWQCGNVSPLRERYLAAGEKVLGYRPRVRVIHAGLECGIISSKLPKLDIISIGPNIKNIHSPDEALDIASCERFEKIVFAMLESRGE